MCVKMASLLLTTLVVYLLIYNVACIGQFFEITTDDVPLKSDVPFLSSGDFKCGRNASCTAISRSSGSKQGNDPSSKVSFAMKKVNG